MEAFFDGIREVLHGYGHAAVDGDRVADNVSKYYRPHEVDLFHTAYDGTLRVVDEAKGVWKTMGGLARGRRRLGKETEKEGGRGRPYIDWIW